MFYFRGTLLFLLAAQISFCVPCEALWPFASSPSPPPRAALTAIPVPPNPSSAYRTAEAQQLWSEMEAKARLSSCWKRALEELATQCAAVKAQEELRSKLTLAMAACDADADGREGSKLFSCRPSESHRRCLGRLTDAQYTVFIQYRLHTDVLCAYLQEELFQERTELAVKTLHAAAAEGMASLYTLAATSEDLVASAEAQQEAQRVALTLTHSLHDDLQAMHASQLSAVTEMQDAVVGIVSTANNSTAALREMKEVIDAAAAMAGSRLSDIAQRAADHYDVVERRTGSLLHALGRVEAVQQVLLSTTLTAALWKAWAVTAAVVYTLTVPVRTAAARTPCFWVLCVGLSVTLRYYFGGNGAAPLLLPSPPTVHGVCTAAAMGIIVWCGYRYVEPLVLQRIAMREEMHQLCAALVASQQRNVVSVGDKEQATTLASADMAPPLPISFDVGRPFSEAHYNGIVDDVRYDLLRSTRSSANRNNKETAPALPPMASPEVLEIVRNCDCDAVWDADQSAAELHMKTRQKRPRSTSSSEDIGSGDQSLEEPKKKAPYKPVQRKAARRRRNT